MKVVAIIQARMSSTRLPGKVLLEIGGSTMLEWVVKRARRAQMVDESVVATTLDSSDDPVFELCKAKDYQVNRGSVHDVLDRYYLTAKQFKAEIVVRITADCPLIDPSLIDEAVRLTFAGTMVGQQMVKDSPVRFDFVTNRLPPPWGRTFPIGLDVEVFTFELLEEAWKLTNAKHQREHVTPYFYEGVPSEHLKSQSPNSLFSATITPEGHHIALMHHTPDYGHYRWTVDVPEDLELVRKIVANFPSDTFTWRDVLALVQKKPELNLINAHIQHKNHLDTDDRTKCLSVKSEEGGVL